MNYMLHYCKDRQCNVGFIDADLYNNSSPPKWKYCPECVSKGRVNPNRKPVDPEAVERMRMLREKRLQEAQYGT